MDESDITHNPRATLIIGCGYLGKQLARQLLTCNPDQPIFAAVRSQISARSLVPLGLRPLLLDVTQPLTLAAARAVLEPYQLDIYYMIPPGRKNAHPGPKQTVIGGIINTLNLLRELDIRKAILISSSAVYGQSENEIVSADTPPEPNNEKAKLLLEGEQLWLNHDYNYYVLRLAGLFGPKRVVGLSAISSGAPVVGNPNAMLNLIHVEDAASLLIAIIQSQTAGHIELGIGPPPLTRHNYYNMLAEMINVPAPKLLNDEAAAKQFDLNLGRLQRTSSKQLDNTITRERTGWSPVHIDLRTSIHNILSQSRK
ncbi:NAD-dependent epimerase/dehydratase family protein [Poriferisphaera sp. WC338]|uniref:NAD-dependent epimerase/dehydratase family protein n=1 Tax=Poriferisphaera sp. WC338 TaxID=3425129 RepID=UPI003D817922